MTPKCGIRIAHLSSLGTRTWNEALGLAGVSGFASGAWSRRVGDNEVAIDLEMLHSVHPSTIVQE